MRICGSVILVCKFQQQSFKLFYLNSGFLTNMHINLILKHIIQTFLKRKFLKITIVVLELELRKQASRGNMAWLRQLVTLPEFRCSVIWIPVQCSTLCPSLLPLSSLSPFLLPSTYLLIKNLNYMRIIRINVKPPVRGTFTPPLIFSVSSH